MDFPARGTLNSNPGGIVLFLPHRFAKALPKMA